MDLFPTLANFCTKAVDGFGEISTERRLQLDALANYVLHSKQNHEAVNLMFICTHNSRRSHMAQLWALAAAQYYEIDGVHSYSGGTEATAYYKSAIASMKSAGIRITKVNEGENPIYETALCENGQVHNMWSKKYDHPSNPTENYAAIMVCTDADQNCPYIPGATRLAIPFDDPKAFDGTPSESSKYDERCLQIATEMLHVMNQVKIGQ